MAARGYSDLQFVYPRPRTPTTRIDLVLCAWCLGSGGSPSMASDVSELLRPDIDSLHAPKAKTKTA